MGEQRNLTEDNVNELKESLDKMKKDNPDLEYNFYNQDQKKGDAEDLITIVKGIRNKLETFDRKFNLIFDGHVLIDGIFKKVEV